MVGKGLIVFTALENTVQPQAWIQEGGRAYQKGTRPQQVRESKLAVGLVAAASLYKDGDSGTRRVVL